MGSTFGADPASAHSQHWHGLPAATGLGRLGREQAHWLMVLHEGEWLGPQGETIYVLLNGLGLLWMLSTGVLILLSKWLR